MELGWASSPVVRASTQRQKLRVVFGLKLALLRTDVVWVRAYVLRTWLVLHLQLRASRATYTRLPVISWD